MSRRLLIKQWLARFKWVLLIALIVMTVLSIAEPEFIYRSTHNDWRGGAHTLSTTLYAVLFILCFVAFEQVSLPFYKTLSQLGGKTYGIYLLHPKLMELAARVIAKIAPLALAYQLPLLLILPIPAIGLALLFIDAVARSPARRVYAYLFG
jgi:peptidoglycan/LPS O-acetylase OafA/YrhL